MKLDTQSLAHTKWNCKYHIVFAAKFRRRAIYGKVKKDIGIMLRNLCAYKEVDILEAEACPEHIHMLISIKKGQIKSPFRGKPVKSSRLENPSTSL